MIKNPIIAILLPDLRGGGVERVRIALAHEFVQAGYHVEFIVMQAKGELMEEAQASFSIINLKTSRMRGVLLPLIRYLRRRRPYALLAAMWPLTAIAPIASRLSGQRCKLLVSEHNTLSLQYKSRSAIHHKFLIASMSIGYYLSDYRVAVSNGVANDIASLSGFRADSFNVIHNPVPPRYISSADSIAVAEQLWKGAAGARIVTVGSMKAQKNHPLLLHAFAKLEREDARLMYVGDGLGRDELITLASDLGIEEQVIFAGFHSDPTPFYQTADLFALSSNYEGFGNVIIEAMNCGIPVVSTDCPSGPAEILENGRYGRLVPVGDVEAMATALAATLDAPLEAEVLQRRAADFNPSKAAQAYLNLLELS